MSGIVAALAAPLRALLDTFGTGDLSVAGVDRAIRAVEAELARVSAQTDSTAVTVGRAWTGADATSAQRTIGDGGTAAGALSQHTGSICASVTTAADVVSKGRTRLQAILDSFVSKAEAADPTLLNPAGLIAVLALAADHLQQALDVLRSIREELDGETDTVAGLAGSTPTAPGTVDGGAATTPASTTATSSPATASPTGTGSGSGSGSAGGGSGSPVSGLASALTGGSRGSSTKGSGKGSAAQTVAASRRSGRTTVSADGKGGYDVRLPDGTVVKAPNAKAAAAVQAALTQLGVPYAWGGTTPGVGLDCSGFTQWAYRQAGIELPRLADQQTVGASVSYSDLRPGDLAVWSGHVALVLGDGRMIEAGDPVQISAVRTDNIGQQFHGFFRPTG
ncbi:MULTISPECIES: C40 family peptidase [Tsukamurella]|uniref:NlpC/P60 family protein n=2 Tax=Tsukamurella TaxID=2060 RepID=A0A5C5S8V9_9ACTN|nr:MULTISPECIES: C40 family peptidase [Tsukamurella]NMD57566.1 C40 family peptidase [Tsukamurella columbiensis]TWS30963.1 NlpC/P60 family protein [Tsukamurella conjunctivitidis]